MPPADGPIAAERTRSTDIRPVSLATHEGRHDAASGRSGPGYGRDMTQPDENGLGGGHGLVEPAAVTAWIAEDPDPVTRAELSSLLAAYRSGDATAGGALAEAFSGPLEFGTAGLRGRLGGGPHRMNRVVVIRAAAGLAHYLRSRLGEGFTVVIGYDARHNSEVFARDTASVITGAGGRALMFDSHCPTPVLAYALRALEADAGVMVTASHNPISA